MKPRAHRRRAHWHVAATIGAALAVLGGLGVLGYGLAAREALDARGCPSDGPAGHVVLLVDATDRFSATQQLAFAQLLGGLGAGQVRKGDLLSVFVLADAFDAAANPVFERCHPGTGEDASRWNANPERLRQRYSQEFLAPLARVAETIRAAQPAAASPIFEMLQVVAINGFRRNAVRGARRLLVVSDMLQNTASFSHYRGEPSFERMRQLPEFQRLRVDLRGVQVELRYLMHTPAMQNRRHAKFWEDYFREMGASLDAIGLIEG